MTYATECHDLAMVFLDEEPDGPVLTRAAHDLAQQIQDLIDSFLAHELPEMRREHAQALKDREDYRELNHSVPKEWGEPMAMLPNDHHPGARCSCRECLREWGQE